MPTRRRRITRAEPLLRHCLWAGLASLVCSGMAHGQARTAYVGVSQGYTQENNVFRAPRGQGERNDSYLSTGAFAALDLPVSRQRLYFSGSARSNRFNELSQLDNLSYALTTGLDWATLERLSGSISYAANRNLASYGGESDPRLTSKNVESSRQFDALARVGDTTRLSTELSYQARAVAYSAPEFNFREFDQSAVKLAMVFRSSAKLSVGAGLRSTRGKYPRYRSDGNGNFSPSRFRRNDVDLSINWVPTGLSTVTGRLSVGRQTNAELTQNEFSGVTGALSWNYRPSDKTRFVASVSRDTGAETRFLDFGAARGQLALADTSRLSTAMRLAATYDATSKFQLSGSVAHTRRSLTDAVNSRSGTDRSTRWGLGARYTPSRSIALECNVSKEGRTASDPSLSFDYDADTVACTAQAQLTIR